MINPPWLKTRSTDALVAGTQGLVGHSLPTLQPVQFFLASAPELKTVINGLLLMAQAEVVCE